MTISSVAPPRVRQKTVKGRDAQAIDRSVQRIVQTIWLLLFVNVLTFTPGVSVIPIPSVVGKSLTQGSLQVALVLALLINRKLVFRPNVFLSLVSLMALEAIVTLLVVVHVGTIYRTFRYLEFVAVLWLLTPFWGRRDMLLVRCHLRAMLVAIISISFGLTIAPGRAMKGGRLQGVIWPIAPTQVAHYAAVTMGMVIILWLTGNRKGRSTVLVVIPAVLILLLTHTRTALLALIVGVLVAGLSIFLVNARVRKVFVVSAAVIGTALALASGPITSWLTRGQSAQQLNNLTGRTNFWGPLLAFQRDRFQEIFGFGLSNGSFEGLPVDSNWILSYQDQGLFGDVICGLILIFLLIQSLFEPRRFERAMSIFFVAYCLIASFTEVGYTNPSPYMLDLTIAASLVIPVMAKREITTPR